MNAANNIYIQPGDRVYVYREPQKFIAFGASGQQGEFPFDAWRINLAEAVAKAGGLVDTQADAASVFLYRQEPRDVAALLGANVSGFAGPTVPVIFQISLADPSGYFLASKLLVRNQDVLFIANAKEVEISKFLVAAQPLHQHGRQRRLRGHNRVFSARRDPFQLNHRSSDQQRAGNRGSSGKTEDNNRLLRGLFKKALKRRALSV